MSAPGAEVAVDEAAAVTETAVATRSMQAIGTTAVGRRHRRGRWPTRPWPCWPTSSGASTRPAAGSAPTPSSGRSRRTAAERPVAVSPLLFEVLEVACRVASETAGIVDPTIGSALIELGYDRDFDERRRRRPAGRLRSPTGPRLVADRARPRARTVAIPIGVHVDLGATAKAFAADRAAGPSGRVARLSACWSTWAATSPWPAPAPGTDGPSASPPSAATPLASVDQVVTIVDGGLATSGTTARTWLRNGRPVHHIVDPWTGAGRARRSGRWCRWRHRPAWRPTPGAPPRWSGARTPSATSSLWGCRPAWSTPTATSCSCGGWPPDTDAGRRRRVPSRPRVGVVH